MNFALDLDGTISVAAPVFREIGSALVTAGHTVTVLTGALHDFPESARTAEGRLGQLRALGLRQGVDFTDLHICIGASGREVAELKRNFCQERGISLLIDDEPMYCDAVAEVTHVAQFRRPRWTSHP